MFLVKRLRGYYLGGKIETLEEIKARNDPAERTLLSNMEINCYPRVIVNTNSWRWTQPLKDDDVVLDIVIGPNGKGLER